MAGHSKWSNIKHRKAAQDAKKGKIFTKIATEITVAAKLGGGDPDANPRLRTALMKARSVNMPKDNVERAIKKGVGDNGGNEYTEKTYEGYGPGGVAFVIETLTDNVNRTVSDIRWAFSKYGGNLGTDGSVAWQFDKKGLIIYERSKIDDTEKLFEQAIENGADDVKEEEDSYQITCEPGDFMPLKEALDGLGLEADYAEVTQIPQNTTRLEGNQAESVTKMIDVLEDLDDVQNVYHNGELPDN